MIDVTDKIAKLITSFKQMQSIHDNTVQIIREKGDRLDIETRQQLDEIIRNFYKAKRDLAADHGLIIHSDN